ncbi:hypothetical protein SAMN04487904_10222 [Actinopolyspora lacussalsi subsp. righensis]|uniref:8-oxo-dGTP diphosphatase n=1 Tax=Actinopolyspora righensis TaxID=995060 RepID=A0A1I6XWM1_9ACTN|nr:hypothetical protein [Actinopolyspora righensis]SFT42808.1 hypothetical protein SAMN04487904_10222 [Actinopolyspora righensis]
MSTVLDVSTELAQYVASLLFTVTLDVPEPTSQKKHLEFHWVPLGQLTETNIRPTNIKDALVTAKNSVPFWRGLSTGKP